MNTPKTNYSQPAINKDSRYGWTVTSYLDFQDDIKIKIKTMKRHTGWLGTIATAMRQSGAFESHFMNSDYSALIVSEKVRVTEKAAMAQHMEALAERDDIVAAAKAHYAKQLA